MKAGIKSILYVWFILVFPFRIAMSGIGDWTTYTNMNEVSEILLRGGKLWCATTGGVVVLDINQMAFTKLTNVNGLGSNYLYSVATDSGDNLWFGGQNGTLTKYSPDDDSWKVYNFIDRDGSRLHLNNIAPGEGELWIATNRALSLFLIDKHGGEIKETYRRLGEHLNGEEEVTCVRVVGNRIWAGLIGGVATANRNDPNLLDFSRWVSFTKETSVGLGSNSILCLTNLGDDILVGTDQGVFKFNSLDSTWQDLGLDNHRINDLESMNQLLYAATNVGIYVYQNQAWTPLSTSGLLSTDFNSLTADSQGNIWAGTADQGISTYIDSKWKNYLIDGPPSNVFLDMETDDSGRVWCAHAADGASLLYGTEWTSLCSDAWIDTNSIVAVEKDQKGNIWFSSWGGGLMKRDLKGITQTVYNETNSPLKGTASNPAYVVVNDLIIDEIGNRWFPNWEPSDSTRLVCSPSAQDTSWVVFYDREGINSILLLRVFAKGGHLFVCTRDRGLYDFNYNWTLENKSDDQITLYTSETDHLSDNAVLCAIVDKDDVLWVGTARGLDQFDSDFERFRPVKLPDPLGPQVNDIAVDERNNKWIATVNGLGKINAKGEFTEYFTTFNSNLCANNVLRLHIDKNTGDIWIGTDNGLSRFESGIGAPAKELSEVVPFPNPLVMETGIELLTFDRLPYQAVVRIFTVAGDLVKEIKSGNQWDGRNQAGELVASGIYLFHVQDPSGKSAVGKIAVIRR